MLYTRHLPCLQHTTTSGSEVSLDSSEHELLPSVYTRQTNHTTANAKIEDERIQRILKENVYDKIVPMIVNIDTQVQRIKSQMEDLSNQIQQIHEHLSSKVGDQRKIIVEGEPPKETGVWNQCVSNPIIERLIIKDEQGKSTESDSTLGDPIED